MSAFRASEMVGGINNEIEIHGATKASNQVTALSTNIRYMSMHQSLNMQIEPDRLDPFQTSTVLLTPQMEPLFLYYFSTIMPVVEPALNERDEYQRWLVPLAMSEPALFYALIGCMAHDLEQASSPGSGHPARRSMHVERSQYGLRATRSLNEALKDALQAQKPSTLMAVHFLLWQEVYSSLGMAFVVYSNAHYNVIQPSSEIARCLVQDLQSALKATDLSASWGSLSTTLIWVLFLGAHMSCGQRERPWFIAALAKAARKCGHNSWTDSRTSLLSYYYSDRVFEVPFRVIWTEIESLAPLLDGWLDV
jgi:hypothetical protein